MKNILITGAAGNLGKACVQYFLQHEYRVLATASAGKKDTLPNGVIGFEADLTSESAVDQLVETIHSEYKTIDAALLLAGGYTWGPLHETTLADIHRMITLNFETAFHTAQKVFQKMCAQPNGGHLVLVGARPALVAHEAKKNVAYALSKSLIFKLAEILNAEGKDNNVVTSVLVPSIIDTPPNRKDMPQADFSKWVTPEQIAEALYFVVSQSSLREPVLKMYGGV